MTPGQLLVALTDSAVFLKVVGRATFALGLPFKQVIEALQARGAHRFVLDLTECLMMDSTFLGVLAGFCLKSPAGADSPRPGAFQLMNPSERVLEVLENLGIAHLFEVVRQTANPATYTTPAPLEASKAALSRTSLEAHQTLMALNPANVAKFKDVVEFLQHDLARLTSQPKD